MLRMIKGVLCSFALLLTVGTALAQDDEQQGAYVYVTYLICNSADLGVTDEIAKYVFAPAYDAAVEAGDITAWGWLAHHTGGTWRRALYHTAPNVDALLDASDAVGAKIDESAPEASRIFAEACPSHEDYIWQSTPGSGGNSLAGNRGKAGFSVYFVCDQSKETRADEIVAKHLGPIYQKQVDAGNLTSWGWLEHNVGGHVRRLLTSTAADHKKMLKTRDAIIEEITSGKNEKVSKEFDSICGSHEDYMWDLQIETP